MSVKLQCAKLRLSQRFTKHYKRFTKLVKSLLIYEHQERFLSVFGIKKPSPDKEKAIN